MEGNVTKYWSVIYVISPHVLFLFFMGGKDRNLKFTESEKGVVIMGLKHEYPIIKNKDEMETF